MLFLVVSKNGRPRVLQIMEKIEGGPKDTIMVDQRNRTIRYAADLLCGLSDAVESELGPDACCGEALIGCLESDNNLRRAVARLIIHSRPFRYDNNDRERGWKLVRDVGLKPVIDVRKLALVPIVHGHGKAMSVDEFVKRAKDPGAYLGQQHAEYLLDNQRHIPKSWREYTLVFPGTEWHELTDEHNRLWVPCLMYASSGKWFQIFEDLKLLAICFDYRYYFLRPSK